MLDDVSLASALARFGDEITGIVSLYLFGSRAGGRAHRESDTDVALLLDRALYPDRQRRFDARIRLTTRLMEALRSADIDVVILNDAPPPLARAIVTRGMRAFCRDTEADHEFVRTTLLRAADLEPFVRRLRRIKLAAIAR